MERLCRYNKLSALTTVIGALCSAMLLEQTMTKVFASVEDTFDTAFSGTSVGGHIGIDIAVTTLPETASYAICLQILISLVKCCLCAYFISRKNPRALIRTRRKVCTLKRYCIPEYS